MMLIYNTILIFLIIQSIYFYNKEKKKTLVFKSWFQFFRSWFIVLGFILFFILFLRVLSFFRASKILDLKNLFEYFDFRIIILFFVFVFFLRKTIMFFAKISFFRLHYFYLSPLNNDYYVFYYKFYILYVHEYCCKIYKLIFYFDKIMLFVLVLLILRDLILFDFVLYDSLYFMRYYSLFKLFYMIVKFVATKQDLLMDYYLFNLCYMGSSPLDEGFYAETIGKRHYDVTLYKNNIIRV